MYYTTQNLIYFCFGALVLLLVSYFIIEVILNIISLRSEVRAYTLVKRKDLYLRWAIFLFICVGSTCIFYALIQTPFSHIANRVSDRSHAAVFSHSVDRLGFGIIGGSFILALVWSALADAKYLRRAFLISTTYLVISIILLLTL